MRMQHEALRHLPGQCLFYLQRGLARRQPGPIADAEKVRVHRDGGLPEIDV
ncbi:hypothetical protein D3C71_1993590 [compost metagenome]